jgi:hypothetical protein
MSSEVSVRVEGEYMIFEKDKNSDLEAKVYNPDFFKMIGFGDAIFDDNQPHELYRGGGKSTFPYHYFEFFLNRTEEESPTNAYFTPDKSSDNIPIESKAEEPKKEDHISNTYKYFSSVVKSFLKNLYPNSSKKYTEDKTTENVPTPQEDISINKPEEDTDVKYPEEDDTTSKSPEDDDTSINKTEDEIAPQEKDKFRWKIKIPIINSNFKLSDYEKSEIHTRYQMKENRASKKLKVSVKGNKYEVGKRVIRIGEVMEGYKENKWPKVILPGTIMSKLNKY